MDAPEPRPPESPAPEPLVPDRPPVGRAGSEGPAGPEGPEGPAGSDAPFGSDHLAADGAQPDRPLFLRDGIEFGRILTMSDGVAAIALTLLVLQIDVPQPPSDGGTAASMLDVARQLGTPLFAFSLSFVIISASWYSHHRFVARLRGLDVPMVVWNFAYLFMLVLVPFASDLVGTYGDNAGAASVYALLMAALYAMSIPGELIARHRGLLTVHESDRAFRARLVSLAIPPGVFLLSIPFALFVDPSGGYWILIAIWPLMRLSERRRARVLAVTAPPTAPAT